MQARRDLLTRKPFEGKHADLSEKIIKVYYHGQVVGEFFGDNERKGSLRWTKK